MQLKALLVPIILTVLACNDSGSVVREDCSDSTEKDSNQETVLSHQIFRNSDGTYGYEIVKDGQVLIRQETVPGMPGNLGFKDSSTALRIAKLVVSKLENGEFPPTVSKDELELQVKK